MHKLTILQLFKSSFMKHKVAFEVFEVYTKVYTSLYKHKKDLSTFKNYIYFNTYKSGIQYKNKYKIQR